MSEKQEQATRERAYAIWEQEGRPEGRSLAHWLQAETEIGTDKIAGITDNGKPVKPSNAGPTVTRRK